MSRTAILFTILPLLVIGGCNSDTPKKNADEKSLLLSAVHWTSGHSPTHVDTSTSVQMMLPGLTSHRVSN